MDRFQGGGSDGYDERIARLIPGYALLHQLSEALLAGLLPADARVLVVGAGTGSDTLALARRHPGWRFCAQDPSADMLAIARRRLEQADVAGRVDFRPCALDALPETDFDAALCLLVLHFLPSPAKRALLSAARSRLWPDAPLLLADLAAAPSAALAAAGGHASQSLGMSAEDAAQMRLKLERDFHPLTEAEQRALLQNAGFAAPERYFQALRIQGHWTRRID
ncbi:tRNA (cmo5U34)-methyltransferase [Chromobacterium alkanivorans]|uniref:class I SAM-dependent methyltransferase n=1 Tax=Chromobacterium alkanivorans TaxID=1071719 RepID=UPI0021672C56|nr:class I SAM-dependent methyltransferase [Chromobacterium alkanivorans]MCS3805929.1 tRNA (cmo5U34)-methyltransferase [Chromobacterium alkanivorans]MCS3820267.1 tRNA (cmo5U34)-methyltransferase [Chromobacterium alkanivorans]MCS3875025.1 tRNA (cmo5U34)-methyltransferase [Chromobacterium alkanivorans]